MLTFRSLADIRKARLPPRIIRALTDVMGRLLAACGPEYDPDDDGYLVLITSHTTDADGVALMGVPWREARLEGIVYDRENRCYLSCILFNNQFGLSLIVPDEPWLDAAFRQRLLHEIGGTDGP